MKLHKVSSRVYANWDGETGGNVGIIELNESALVVNAQYPGSARKFRAAIPKVNKKELSYARAFMKQPTSETSCIIGIIHFMCMGVMLFQLELF